MTDDQRRRLNMLPTLNSRDQDALRAALAELDTRCWVACGEADPPVPGQYLLVIRRTRAARMGGNRRCSIGYWHGPAIGFSVIGPWPRAEVTHWMPLPPLPEPAEGEGPGGQR